jgi:hypothetical protein
MTDRLQLTKPPIIPIYGQAHPSEPIELGQVAVQFEDENGVPEQGTAEVVMRFLPTDRLEFFCPITTEPRRLFGFSSEIGKEKKLRLTERGVVLDVFCGGVGGRGMRFTPTRSGVVVTPPSNAISKATFHLFNFPDFSGPEDYILLTGEPPLQGAKACGRAVLRADGWEITVAAHERTDSLTDELKSQGGYVIMHIGQIVRADGGTFSSEQLEDLLNCVQHFLSFALGRWAGVALAIGFDGEGNRVFEEWGLRITADGPWQGSSSWFDVRHGELLSQVFPGFMERWKSKTWCEPVRHALYWYLGACDRRVGIGVDTGLILAQTALETLAWTYCVLDRKMISAAAFERRNLSAADKLRLLVSSLDIPLEIPAQLSALHGRPGKKWVDGMDAITAIRNSLVHAVADRSLPGGSFYEGWLLSLWYIDLALLRLCGHSGKYANRLAHRCVGQVETVPWA